MIILVTFHLVKVEIKHLFHTNTLTALMNGVTLVSSNKTKFWFTVFPVPEHIK